MMTGMMVWAGISPTGVVLCRNALLLGGLLLLSVMGCTVTWVVSNPERKPALSLEVDSLVLRPIAAGSRIQINAADLALFDKHLSKTLASRERFRVYEFPPTRLPNTAFVEGELTRFQVEEKQGEGVYLRVIDLEVEMRVMPLEGEEPLVTLRRRIAYQKAYPGPDGVSALPLDLENAVAEWTAQVVEVLDPEPVEERIVLHGAREAGLGGYLSHPALIKGNRYAVAGLFDKAEDAWQQVLFDPVWRERKNHSYRISARTLNQLRRMGFQEDKLKKLEPLTGEPEMRLIPFRRLLRERMDGPVEQEGLVLTLADHQNASIHNNLAAAHVNIAVMKRLEKRFDLAGYHLARAYAHNPEPEWLERWNALQEKRNLNPAGLEPLELLNQWLRLPAPATATVRPGQFELSVTPDPAFADTEGAEGAAIRGAPAVQGAPADLGTPASIGSGTASPAGGETAESPAAAGDTPAGETPAADTPAGDQAGEDSAGGGSTPGDSTTEAATTENPNTGAIPISGAPAGADEVPAAANQ